MQKIGFGGGCYWCTEAVFQYLDGVGAVEPGWIRSRPPFDAFSEAVIVDFDPAGIDLQVLLEIHLRTHASQSNHGRRLKYRSAVYVFGEDQAAEARAGLARLQREFDAPIVTRVLPFEGFRASPPSSRNYYRDNSDRPFCRTYIDPKLALLRRRFHRYVKTADSQHNEASNARKLKNA